MNTEANRMSIKDGGPAYPCEQHEAQNGEWNQTFERGMSVRDHFAGLAMAAIIPDTQLGFDAICAEAYQYADAMLRAREIGQ